MQLEDKIRDEIIRYLDLEWLTERERLCLKLRWVDRFTLRQVGNAMGVNASRVTQIEAKALRKIRRHNGLSWQWPLPICDEKLHFDRYWDRQFNPFASDFRHAVK